MECIDRLQRIGMDWLSAAPHARLGDLDLSAGDHRRARMWYDRSIALWSARDLGPGAPQTLAGLARLDTRRGRSRGRRDAPRHRAHHGRAVRQPRRVPVDRGRLRRPDGGRRPSGGAATLFGLGLRHGPRAGRDVRRIVDAELAPFFGSAVDDHPGDGVASAGDDHAAGGSAGGHREDRRRMTRLATGGHRRAGAARRVAAGDGGRTRPLADRGRRPPGAGCWPPGRRRPWRPWRSRWRCIAA